MRQKKIGRIGFLCILLLFLMAAVGQAAPKRVVLVPWEGSDVPETVELKASAALYRAFHVPLNGTLQAVEILPADEVLFAWEDLLAEEQKKGKTFPMEENCRLLSEKLSADIVVAPFFTDFSEFRYWNWQDELCLESHVEIRLFTYVRAAGKSFVFTGSRWYRDTYTLQGTASQLADEALDQALRKADFRQWIFPKKQDQ